MRIRKLNIVALGACLFCTVLFTCHLSAEDVKDNWHRFRGPDGNGVAENAKPPLEWSNSSDNLKWKSAIPGKGSSSPIVWGDHIFVTTAVDTRKNTDGEVVTQEPSTAAKGRDEKKREAGKKKRGRGKRRARSVPKTVQEFWVYCIDRNDGSVAWKTKVGEAIPHEGTHGTNTYASNSPVTNGEHIYASFGSYGIFCLDMKGIIVWSRDLGDMQIRNTFGEGASPALYEDKLIVNWDHEGQSFIETLDAKTGKTVWKKDRDEQTGWATPLVVKHNDRVQIIINATTVRSYDLEDGSIIWQCGGQTRLPIPTPMVMGDMVICMTGFRASACYAIPLDSEGDITDSDKIIWKNNRDIGPYVPTGVLYKGTVYATKASQPVLAALDAKTGETVIEGTRLPNIRTLYSSLVAANDHVYVTGRSGKTLVLKHGSKFEVVATNDLGEPVDATPALVDQQILIRGNKHLFCFENK